MALLTVKTVCQGSYFDGNIMGINVGIISFIVEMKIQCQHISANVNPKPNSLLFIDSNRVAYAFSNQVAIYDIATKRVLFTIHDSDAHHNRANCIALISCQESRILLCGYDSGFLVGYIITENGWKKAISIKDEAGVISISHLNHAGKNYVFTNNNNSVVKRYSLTDESLTFEEDIAFALNKLIDSIALIVEEEKLLVFVGGVDQKVHCYELDVNDPNSKLTYRFSLSGHQNAITKLAIARQQNDILLASASKDGYIRLWKITSNLEQIKFHKNVYPILSKSKVFLEAVLISHECSVTSLCWVKFGGVLQLASSSLDCTICIWGSTGQAWSVDTRMGQFLGNKNAYFDVLADPSFQYLLALNYTGAVLLWEWRDSKFSLTECFNGHAGTVRALQWNHTGHFLVSASKDQTTRVIARNALLGRYHEVSRAQIHGYDINAVTVLKVKEGVLDVIACGADEKVVRILEPPACFANYLNSFTQANLHLYFPSAEEEKKYTVSKPGDSVLLYEAYSEGGTQVLGLMTKAQRVQREKITSYYQEEEVEDTQQAPVEDLKEAKLDYNRPPHEDYLVKHTLWPQMNKLYGHPHEIETLCRSNVSKRMASSCAALNKQAASVIIWNSEQWRVSKILPFHNYTVYGLQFSPKDTYFASVSKDRKLAVYTGDSLELLFSYQAHLRTITSLSFHKSEELLLTGSRDKTIRLHSMSQRKQVSELMFKHPISSVALCQQTGFQNYFAVGCTNGAVHIGKIETEQLKLLREIQEAYRHTECVNKIKWNGLTFATCSDDFSVRVFQLVIDQ